MLDQRDPGRPKNVWVMKNGTGRPDWLLWKPHLCTLLLHLDF